MIIVLPDGTTEEGDDSSKRAQLSYRVALIGSDGVTWDLNTGPVRLMAGVKGLFDPPESSQWLRQTIGTPGVVYTGEQVEEHDMTLPIRTKGSDPKGWRDVDRAFFRSLRTNAYSVLEVSSPWGDVVTKPILRVSNGAPGDTLDPLLVFRRTYPDLTVVAPQPYWEMPDVVSPFTFSSGLSFFTGAFRFLSSGADARFSKITNPGEVPILTRAIITGPASSWAVGVGSDVISSSIALADGEHRYIDGRKNSIIDDAGNRRYRDMDQISFATLPPGEEIPVVATMSGFSSKSSIVITATPLIERPL